jgi:hypothetical protein
MKPATWFVLLLSAPAFAQTLPDSNVAAANLERRMASLKLFRAPDAAATPAPRLATRQVLPAAARRFVKPQICAMPLLNATPQPTDENMPIVKPAAPLQETQRELAPAPACDETFLRNR